MNFPVSIFLIDIASIERATGSVIVITDPASSLDPHDASVGTSSVTASRDKSAFFIFLLNKSFQKVG
jgi:hypothetical protein